MTLQEVQEKVAYIRSFEKRAWLGNTIQGVMGLLPASAATDEVRQGRLMDAAVNTGYATQMLQTPIAAAAKTVAKAAPTIMPAADFIGKEIPFLGEGVSALSSANNFRRGRLLSGGLDALGTLPFINIPAGIASGLTQTFTRY
jgi:hypothetical protein